MPSTTDEITQSIKDMGYVMAVPRQEPLPSFYKLSDGTVISVLTRINHLVPNTKNLHDLSANTTQEVHAFVPIDKRNPHGKQVQDPTSALIIEEDMKYETLKEDFILYDMSNGSVLGVKTVMAQVQKTDQFNREGEPIYNINANPVIKITKK